MPKRDEYILYPTDLIKEILPKITGEDRIDALIKREPKLKRLTDKLVDRMVTEIFSGVVSREDLQERVEATIRSAVMTGVLIAEAARAEIDTIDLKEAFEQDHPEVEYTDEEEIE